MKLIIGLGNPGKEYAKTRHNAGFLAIDHLLSTIRESTSDSRSNCEIVKVTHDGDTWMIVKPLTYMNLSGTVAQELISYYKLDPTKDLIVIHDELDLPLGEIRISTDSRSAGHNGVQSIIDALGTKNFKRIRIGVENRPDKKTPPGDKYVLQNFTPEEYEILQKTLQSVISRL